MRTKNLCKIIKNQGVESSCDNLMGCIIVKPWSKSWSKQAPKSNKSQIKRKKKDLDLGLTPKSHGPPTPPITFKHEGVLW